MHIYPLPFYTQSDTSFCSHQSLHMDCPNATIWADLSELSTGPQADDAILAVSAWHSSSHWQSSVTRCLLLCFAWAYDCRWFLELFPNLKILTFPFEFQSLNVLSSATGYILLPAPQLTILASKHFYMLLFIFSHVLALSEIIFKIIAPTTVSILLKNPMVLWYCWIHHLSMLEMLWKFSLWHRSNWSFGKLGHNVGDLHLF